MFEWMRRQSAVRISTFEDTLDSLEDRVWELKQAHKRLENRIQALEQENAVLKERLQTLEDTVKTLKPLVE